MNRLAASRLWFGMQPALSAVSCSSGRCTPAGLKNTPAHGGGYSAIRLSSTLATCCAGSSNVQYNAALSSLTSSMSRLHRSTYASCQPHSSSAASNLSLGHYRHMADCSLAPRKMTPGVSTAAAPAAGPSSSSSRPAPRRVKPLRLLSPEQIQQQREERQQHGLQPGRQHALPDTPKQHQHPRAPRQRALQTQKQQQQQALGHQRLVPAHVSTSQTPGQQPIDTGQATMSSQLQYQQPLPSSLPFSVPPSRQQVYAYLKSVQARGGFLTDQRLGKVCDYLSELNDEQWGAVLCQAQHLRLIAGPGSGKTRTITARVAWLLATNTPPEQFLVITFTRKAAGELVERLTSLMGPGVTRKLRPCTFHALCNSLLRKYQVRMDTQDFVIATDEDTRDIVEAIVNPDGKKGKKNKLTAPIQQYGDAHTFNPLGLVRSSRAGGGGSKAGVQPVVSLEKTARYSMRGKKDPVGFYRSAISRLKNFVQDIEGRSGLDLIQETRAAGLQLIPEPLITNVAQVYDLYQQQMIRSNLLDFDDLLHRCLHLLRNDPEVRLALHSRFQHVLIDESQDTNSCQFELVKAITGPQSRLVMVGDPDQAIYGFRGADSQLLSQVMLQHYQDTSHTRFLSKNYRSREPITWVADIVRHQHRLASSPFQKGISMRPLVSDETVILLQAENQYEEAGRVMHQLKQWKHRGYLWGEMALLSRTRDAAQFMYRQMTKAGIPAHMPLGKDFWDSAEVKTVMAVLRCLVQPAAAGEVVKRRIVKKSGLHVPIMQGIGDTTIAKLEDHIKNSVTTTSSSSSSTGTPSGYPATLGSYLLSGCHEDDFSPSDATSTVQRWLAAAAAAAAAAAVGDGPADAPQAAWGDVCYTPESNAVLEQFAPPWCPPEGFKMAVKARAAVARLRGLVVLGRAAAVIYTPADVLQLLLIASGTWHSLLRDVAEGDDDAVRRRSNLEVLLDLASNTRAYSSDSEAETKELMGMLSVSSGGELPSNSSSSSSSEPYDSQDQQQTQQHQEQQSAVGVAVLQSLYDYCVLQGEGDEDQNTSTQKVQLLTMHASKGKEFPCVGVMRVCEGIIPSIKHDDPTPNALEQERNTLFVAMTRAKDHLIVSWPEAMTSPQKLGHHAYTDFEQTVSQFLKPVLAAYKAQQLPGVVYQQHSRQPELSGY